MKSSDSETWKDKTKGLKGMRGKAKSKKPQVVVEVTSGEESEPVRAKTPVRRSRKRKATHDDDSDDLSSIQPTANPKRVRHDSRLQPNVSQSNSRSRRAPRERSGSVSSAGNSDMSCEDQPTATVEKQLPQAPAGTDALMVIFSQMIGSLPPEYLQKMMQGSVTEGINQPVAGPSKQSKESGKGKGRK